MNVDTLGCDADLARIVEARPKQLFRYLAHIGIRQNDCGVITAQFKRDALQILRCRFHDAFARGGRAGEGDLVNVRVRRQQWSKRITARDDVEHARREYARHQFRQTQSRQRRERRWF